MRAYWLHESSWTRVVTHRVRRPNVIAARLASRRRRSQPIPVDGKLLLLAANQLVDPRTETVVPRRELLDRLMEAMTVTEVDGVVGSADILEELTVLNVLEDRLAICDHRSARSGTVGEAIVRSNFDGARFATLGIDTTALAVGVNAMQEQALPVLVDLVGEHGDAGGDYSTDWLDWVGPFDRVTRSLSTGTGVWFSLPALSDIGSVAASNGFPVVIRDTDIPISADAWKAMFEQELPLNVRGLIAGPSALFPLEGSVEDATRALAAAIHTDIEDIDDDED